MPLKGPAPRRSNYMRSWWRTDGVLGTGVELAGSATVPAAKLVTVLLKLATVSTGPVVPFTRVLCTEPSPGPVAVGIATAAGERLLRTATAEAVQDFRR